MYSVKDSLCIDSLKDTQILPQLNEWRVNEQWTLRHNCLHVVPNHFLSVFTKQRDTFPNSLLHGFDCCFPNDEWSWGHFNKYVAYLYILSEKYFAVCSCLIGWSGFSFWILYLFIDWWVTYIFWFGILHWVYYFQIFFLKPGAVLSHYWLFPLQWRAVWVSCHLFLLPKFGVQFTLVITDRVKHQGAFPCAFF